LTFQLGPTANVAVGVVQRGIVGARERGIGWKRSGVISVRDSLRVIVALSTAGNHLGTRILFGVDAAGEEGSVFAFEVEGWCPGGLFCWR